MEEPQKDDASQAAAGKQRVSFHLPIELVNRLRECTSWLAGEPFGLNQSRVVQLGIEEQLKRLEPHAERLKALKQEMLGEAES